MTDCTESPTLATATRCFHAWASTCLGGRRGRNRCASTVKRPERPEARDDDPDDMPAPSTPAAKALRSARRPRQHRLKPSALARAANKADEARIMDALTGLMPLADDAALAQILNTCSAALSNVPGDLQYCTDHEADEAVLMLRALLPRYMRHNANQAARAASGRRRQPRAPVGVDL